VIDWSDVDKSKTLIIDFESPADNEFDFYFLIADILFQNSTGNESIALVPQFTRLQSWRRDSLFVRKASAICEKNEQQDREVH
jgi:hypothetical protein